MSAERVPFEHSRDTCAGHPILARLIDGYGAGQNRVEVSRLQCNESVPDAFTTVPLCAEKKELCLQLVGSGWGARCHPR